MWGLATAVALLFSSLSASAAKRGARPPVLSSSPSAPAA